jgi:hypothetical protein
MIQIKHRITGAVLFECELPADFEGDDRAKQRYAVVKAVSARADLTGADLTGAYLAGAYLARAYLAGAYLARADLTDAYLTDADLTGAYLAGANLSYADLSRADLAGAYLAGARNLPKTNGSEKIQADTAPQDRPPRKTPAECAAEYRARNPDVPVVEALDAKILSVVTSGQGKLNMAQWHTCETTHCRAGWAITLAGEAGAKLEAKVGPHQAGRMIYRASTGRAPQFFATDERAMEDIKRCADESQASV